MRILIDTRLLAKGGTSGIEEYTQNLLQSLFLLDRENQYFLFYNALFKKPLDLPAPGNNVRLMDWRIPNKILDSTMRWLRWPRVDAAVGADLIFSPHFNLLARGRAPRVITFHDLSFIHHPYFFSWRQRFWHWLQDVRRQAKEADRIIAVSEFTKADLVNTLGIAPEKIEVVYSGIAEGFKPADQANPPLVSAPYILYLGTLEPRKNIESLIRAFSLIKQQAALKDFKLVLAGRPGWLYGTILKEAKLSSFRRDIIFWGAATDQERIKLLQEARLFVYPSFFEGFGLPPLEAQACGCPVIAANRTSLPEVIGLSGLLVDPWKVQELAEAMQSVLTKDGLRKELITAGLRNSRRFQWMDTAKQVLSILRSTHS